MPDPKSPPLWTRAALALSPLSAGILALACSTGKASRDDDGGNVGSGAATGTTSSSSADDLTADGPAADDPSGEPDGMASGDEPDAASAEEPEPAVPDDAEPSAPEPDENPAGALEPCTPGAEQTIACNGDGDEFVQESLGPYFVWNNPWNEASSDGSQCTWSTCSNGATVGWGTEFDYDASAPHEVKSYASAVFGWHWTPPGSSLGLQVSEDPSIVCDWSYSLETTSQTTMNIAYDLWLHTTQDPSWGENDTDQPTDEIMIWLYRGNGAGPISEDGRPETTVTLSGADWELHEGQIPGAWAVHSFIRTTNSETGHGIEIGEFLQTLVDLGFLPESRYLSSIEAGTEPFRGSARLDVHSWGCDVQ